MPGLLQEDVTEVSLTWGATRLVTRERFMDMVRRVRNFQNYFPSMFIENRRPPSSIQTRPSQSTSLCFNSSSRIIRPWFDIITPISRVHRPAQGKSQPVVGPPWRYWMVRLTHPEVSPQRDFCFGVPSRYRLMTHFK